MVVTIGIKIASFFVLDLPTKKKPDATKNNPSRRIKGNVKADKSNNFVLGFSFRISVTKIIDTKI